MGLLMMALIGASKEIRLSAMLSFAAHGLSGLGEVAQVQMGRFGAGWSVA
jgi:hypothetical protein